MRPPTTTPPIAPVLTDFEPEVEPDWAVGRVKSVEEEVEEEAVDEMVVVVLVPLIYAWYALHPT